LGSASGTCIAKSRDAASAGDIRFRDYLLENVYLRTTAAQRSEIMGLWHEEDALGDTSEAKRRSHEAVFLVRSPSGQLAGLSTVGFVRLKDGRKFYAYRMFLRTQDRVPYLMLEVVIATRDFLRTFQHPEVPAAGLVHVNENPKLMRPGMRRLFERTGYRYWGKTPAQEDVWGVEFEPRPASSARADRWREAVRSFLRPSWRPADRTPFLELV
jgi:hypothetical protein